MAGKINYSLGCLVAEKEKDPYSIVKSLKKNMNSGQLNKVRLGDVAVNNSVENLHFDVVFML